MINYKRLLATIGLAAILGSGSYGCNKPDADSADDESCHVLAKRIHSENSRYGPFISTSGRERPYVRDRYLVVDNLPCVSQDEGSKTSEHCTRRLDIRLQRSVEGYANSSKLYNVDCGKSDTEFSIGWREDPTPINPRTGNPQPINYDYAPFPFRGIYFTGEGNSLQWKDVTVISKHDNGLEYLRGNTDVPNITSLSRSSAGEIYRLEFLRLRKEVEEMADQRLEEIRRPPRRYEPVEDYYRSLDDYIEQNHYDE